MKYCAEAYANGTAPTSKTHCLTGRVHKSVEVMEMLPELLLGMQKRDGDCAFYLFILKIRQGERGLRILAGN